MFKKIYIYSDSQCCWKKYSDFGGGKKKIIWFRVFVIWPNVKFAICATTTKILTLVLSEKNPKNIPPTPLQVKSSVPYCCGNSHSVYDDKPNVRALHLNILSLGNLLGRDEKVCTEHDPRYYKTQTEFNSILLKEKLRIVESLAI